jgi:hypothetical protein
MGRSRKSSRVDATNFIMAMRGEAQVRKYSRMLELLPPAFWAYRCQL